MFSDWGVMTSFAPRYDSSEATISQEESAMVLAWMQERRGKRWIEQRQRESVDANGTEDMTSPSPTAESSSTAVDGEVDAMPLAKSDPQSDTKLEAKDEDHEMLGPDEVAELLKDSGVNLEKELENVAWNSNKVDAAMQAVTKLLLELADLQVHRLISTRVPERSFKHLQSLSLPTSISCTATSVEPLQRLVTPTNDELSAYHRIESFLYLLVKDLAPSQWFDQKQLQAWLQSDYLTGSREALYRGTLASTNATRQSLFELSNEVLPKGVPPPTATEAFPHPASTPTAQPMYTATPGRYPAGFNAGPSNPTGYPMNPAAMQQYYRRTSSSTATPGMTPTTPMATGISQQMGRQMMTDPRAYQAYYQAYYANNLMRTQQQPQPAELASQQSTGPGSAMMMATPSKKPSQV